MMRYRTVRTAWLSVAALGALAASPSAHAQTASADMTGTQPQQVQPVIQYAQLSDAAPKRGKNEIRMHDGRTQNEVFREGLEREAKAKKARAAALAARKAEAAATREADKAATALAVSDAKDAAAREIAAAEAEARKAREEAERMMKEMQEKYGLDN